MSRELTILFLIGVVLVICGLIVDYLTMEKERARERSRAGRRAASSSGAASSDAARGSLPPPLPPRRENTVHMQAHAGGTGSSAGGNGSGSSSGSGNSSFSSGSGSSSCSLPPRRPSSSGSAGSGPRGLRPEQFPCCPFDRSSNSPGEPQVIFWDGEKQRYRCSRGHEFMANGRPF